MPVGGFGNLIALPLQRRAREHGNSVFIDEALRPYDDQWAFLSSAPRLSADAVSDLVADAESRGRVLGVRMPVEDEDADEPWRMTPSRRREPGPINAPMPSKVGVVIADQVYIDRTELPAAMTARLMRLAAFQNPEFYRAQSMRFPTFDKPRIISCAELHPRHVGLPRGCLDEAIELICAHGVEAVVEDLRTSGRRSRLKPVSRARYMARRSRRSTRSCRMIPACWRRPPPSARRSWPPRLSRARARNTLILVHRRELLAQWVERLKTFLDIDPKHIGVIGGGRRKPTGVIDVALIQSLVRGGEVSDLVADYGHLVFDECHHLSAASFELVARRAKARYVLGLSATVARKDGHHPIIFMQCGPVRHRVDARAQAAERGVAHRAKHRATNFQLPPPLAASDRPPCRRSMPPSPRTSPAMT